MRRLGTLKQTVTARSSINPIKMVQKIAFKESVENLSFPPMLLESQISSQPLAKRLILTFFYKSFLSRDAHDQALGRHGINGRSKLTSQRQFASVRRRAQCFATVIASSTVGGSLGPFDRFWPSGEPKNFGSLCSKHNRSNNNLGERKTVFQLYNSSDKNQLKNQT